MIIYVFKFWNKDKPLLYYGCQKAIAGRVRGNKKIEVPKIKRIQLHVARLKKTETAFRYIIKDYSNNGFIVCISKLIKLLILLNPHAPVAQKLRISADSSLIRQKIGTFLYKMMWLKVGYCK